MPGYHGVDLRAGLNVGRWRTFKAYVKNLTDERGISSIGPETIDPLAAPFGAIYVAPRTVGLSASIEY
ncbi:hypothetical protein STENM36S_02040 [Streptomyces tendae]